jgi:transposase InsO family protein
MPLCRADWDDNEILPPAKGFFLRSRRREVHFHRTKPFSVPHQAAVHVDAGCQEQLLCLPETPNSSAKSSAQNAVLTEKIKTLFEAYQQRYGRPRIHAALRQQGETCSLGRVKRLMRRVGLYAVSARKFKPRKERIVKLETPNLLLQHSIRPSAINQVWHTDITYVSTDEGWLYLAGVMDGFSK